MSENRDEATGQFASAEPLFGKEGVEAAQGYVPLPDSAITGIPPADDSPTTVEEAAADLSASRSDVATYSPVDAYLEGLDANVTLTVEQAAEMTTLEKEAKAKAAEDAAAEKLRNEVDEKRGQEAMKSLDPQTQALIADGLDPDVAQALQKPQVREALESEFAKADQVRESHTAGLQHAQQFAQAAFFEAVPELAGLPLDQVEAGLQILQEVDPARFETAMRTLNRVGQIAQQQAAVQQQQAYVAQQQFVNHVQAEDARLVEMVGSDKVAAEANQALVTYLTEHGIPQNQMVDIVWQNPVLRTAEARQTIWKAAKYDAIQKAKPAATRAIPPVQRPGTSNVARSSEPSSKIAALERQLSSATGDKAARISAQIYGLEKAARG